VFLLQYAVAVMAAMKLDSTAGVAMLGQAVSGACAGYFLGWGIALIRRWRSKSAALESDGRIST
jgi:prepilin signal peptidase PulO-like enzyme (type II secretory pathway)